MCSKAAWISRMVLALKISTCKLIARAAVSTSRTVGLAFAGLAGLTSSATRTAFGMSSRRSSSRFATNSAMKKLMPVALIFRPTVFDRDILALAKACLFQTFAKCAQAVRESIRRYRGEKSDHRHRPLLRARRERPGDGCAAGKGD